MTEKKSIHNLSIEIKKLLSTMLDDFQKEREKTEPYKEMFKAGSTYTGLLRELQHRCLGHVLDATTTLRKKNIRISDDVYSFLLAIPYLFYKLEKQVEKEEGVTYCTDKTFYLLSERLKEIIGEIKGGQDDQIIHTSERKRGRQI